MSDNKDLRTSQDRSRVSGSEEYEVSYLSAKFDVEPAIVRKALSEVGNSREAVEEFLSGYKGGQPF